MGIPSNKCKLGDIITSAPRRVSGGPTTGAGREVLWNRRSLTPLRFSNAFRGIQPVMSKMTLRPAIRVIFLFYAPAAFKLGYTHATTSLGTDRHKQNHVGGNDFQVYHEQVLVLLYDRGVSESKPILLSQALAPFTPILGKKKERHTFQPYNATIPRYQSKGQSKMLK